MSKLKKAAIILIVILTLGISWKLYRKYKESDKLKIGDLSLKPSQKIETGKDLVSILTNGLELTGFISIRNLSNKNYILNQLNIDCFSPKTEKLIAEQTNMLQEDIKIEKTNLSEIPLTYKVSPLKVLNLLKESEIIPENVTIWQIIKSADQYITQIKPSKLKIKFKGFIQAEGITLNVNEYYYPYE